MTGRRFIVRRSSSSFPGVRDYLVETHGYVDLVRHHSRKGLTSRIKFAVDIPGDFLFTLRNRKALQGADIVIGFRHTALPLLVLAWLGLMRYRRLYWFDFNIHDQKWFPAFRLLFKLDRPNNRYIVRTRGEVELYCRELRQAPEKFLVLPFGEWEGMWRQYQKGGQTRDVAPSELDGALIPSTPYYFAGGAANRDYGGLIEAFRHIPQRLVIVCSSHYYKRYGINGIEIPGNVLILKDLPLQQLEALIQGATACILPMASDTSGGLSLLLAYMRHHKIIIGNRVKSTSEYLDGGGAGIIVESIKQDLHAAIARLEAHPQDYEKLADAAKERYDRLYSITPLTDQLAGYLNAD